MLEELAHVPGNLENHTHMSSPGCMRKTRGSPELAPVAHLYALHKQEVKTKAEL